MRIISDFHDFYDSAMAHGADMRLVFERNQRIIDGADADLGIDLQNLPAIIQLRDGKTRRYTTDHTVHTHILLFCGRLIPFVVDTKPDSYYGGPWKTTTSWSIEDLQTTIDQDPDVARHYACNWIHRWAFNRKALHHVFGFRADPLRIAEIHERHRSPIILYRNLLRSGGERQVETVVNPNLKDIGFQTQSDAFATFQDIAMYLGGVMHAGERQTVTIPDNIRAAKHGLDDWSFRKKVR